MSVFELAVAWTLWLVLVLVVTSDTLPLEALLFAAPPTFFMGAALYQAYFSDIDNW